MNFRKDINGLRAIAVMAVVLFHFNADWMPGGFVGVDVFFVISGFLMTGIIFRGMEQEKFSIWKFYAARANRIIPALAALSAVLLVFGWFFLPPIDYRVLGKHVTSSLGFISNMVYWREAGYFDTLSHEKWLLHTWSLSVEWQFYILYPLLLVGFRRFLSLQKIKFFILIGAVLGFLLCVVVTSKAPAASYFLLPTRAWEMMLGGVAYLYPFTVLSEVKRRLLEFGGITLIVGSCFLISSEVAWPGYWALVPVTGAFLVIQSQRGNSWLTGNVVCQKLGAWSYSIYLWHWPMVVMLSYLALTEKWIYLLIALSVFLGFLSYTLIESKNIQLLNAREPFYACWNVAKVLPVLLLIVVGGGVYWLSGVPSRVAEGLALAGNESSNKSQLNCMVPGISETINPCYVGVKENIVAIVVGDSHADALTTSISSALDLNKQGLLALTLSSCPFVFDVRMKKESPYCFKRNQERLDLIKKHPNVPVFVIGRWSVYIYGQSDPARVVKTFQPPFIYFDEGNVTVSKEQLLLTLEKKLEQTLCDLKKTNPTFITTPIPEMPFNVPQTIARQWMLHGKPDMNEVSLSWSEYEARNKKLVDLILSSAQACNVDVLRPEKFLCQEGGCISNVNGRPIYYDGDHMSEYGNKLLTPMFRDAFSK